MGANFRFDTSAINQDELAFKGGFQIGQRGNLIGAGLDRSGSFREGNEGRVFNSDAGVFGGNSTPAGDLPPLSQCLILDPISIGDQKYARPGELRRVLGLSFGSNSEEYSHGAGHSKSPPPTATEELKRFKASIVDATIQARGRSRKLDESLCKLNKYCEALNTRTQLRNDMMISDRSGGSNLLRMATQIHRHPQELANQRLDERSKNVILQKRVRTSLAETRADGRSNSAIKQASVLGRERDLLQEGCEASDVIEEKIRKLPAGGETWDRKMKRKRSMGAVIGRHVDGNGEVKRVMHVKLHNESGLQFSEPQGLRTDFKADVTSPTASLNVSVVAKNELDKVPKASVGGSNQDRVVPKGSRLMIRENNHMGGAYSLPKGKASRALRAGSTGGNLSPVSSRSSGPPEGGIQPTEGNKVHSLYSNNSRKRPLPTGSSSPTMAQWVGQRPQKMSRTRRANLVSPVLDSEEMHMTSEGCSAVSMTPRMATPGANGSLVSRSAVSTSQQVKVKLENHSSPARLSESDESGGGENVDGRLKQKGSRINELDDRNVKNSLNLTLPISLSKRNKPNKEEVADVFHRQGRNARGASVLRASISPTSEKLKTSMTTKPLKNMKPVSEKNGSKSGRPPLKKPSDRKAISRLGHTTTGNSPDFTGEVDDDHEDLLAAANSACNASYSGCSSSFWKKKEPVFAPVSFDSIASLKQLLKSTEDAQAFLSCMCATSGNSMDCCAYNDDILSQALTSGEIGRSFSDQVNLRGAISDMDGKSPNLGVPHGTGSKQSVTPLYQRVLSALIMEDQIEDLIIGDQNVSTLNGSDDFPAVACITQEVAYGTRVRSGCKPEYLTSLHAQNQCASDSHSPTGTSTVASDTSIHDQAFDIELLQEHRGSLHSNIELPVLAGVDNDGIISPSTNSSCMVHRDYDQVHLEDRLLMELQSVGLCSDFVPDLMDGEDEPISEEIIQLEKQLHQQLGKKEAHLKRLIQSAEDGREREQRALEQVAMDKLVELAYKKKLATRGSSAMRLGLPKVSKQAAMAFMKRTLSRCHKFEETGKSCFREPAYKDALYATPSRYGDEEPLNCSTVQQSGPILNRGKKKELLLDDVGVTASMRASTVSNSLLGGTKGKRSERERDKDTSGKNSNKGGRSATGYLRAERERKTKSKPKQKTAQLSTTGNGFPSKFTEATDSDHPSVGISSELDSKCANRKSNDVPASRNPKDSSKELEDPIDFSSLQLHELDSMDVGVDNDLGGHPDLDSWLNIDVDNLQEHNLDGLDIPMDDLSDLNMLLA